MISVLLIGQSGVLDVLFDAFSRPVLSFLHYKVGVNG